MKKFYLVLLLSLVLSNLAAQSKKEVIETLTFNIDSLNIVISKLKQGHSAELETNETQIESLRASLVRLETDKLQQDSRLDSLQKLNMALSLENQIALSQISVLSDSLFVLKKRTSDKSMVLSENLTQALGKVKSEWSYFMDDFSVENCLLLDSLNKICNEDRCISFLLTESFLVVSYRVKEVAELGTQIIELSSNQELLKEKKNSIYVEGYDKKNKVLLISSEGYDDNGHFWQKGTWDSKTKALLLGSKEH